MFYAVYTIFYNFVWSKFSIADVRGSSHPFIDKENSDKVSQEFGSLKLEWQEEEREQWHCLQTAMGRLLHRPKPVQT